MMPVLLSIKPYLPVTKSNQISFTEPQQKLNYMQLRSIRSSAFAVLMAVTALSGCAGSSNKDNADRETNNQSQKKEDTAQADYTRSAGLEDNRHMSAGIGLPAGFEAEVVHEGVGAARHIAVRDNGDMYIALREKTKGSGTVALRDTDQDGEAEKTEYFGDFTGTGVAIHNGYLYRTSETAVYRYPMKDDQLLPEMKRETVLSGLPDQNQHAAKPISFDGKGNMYINVGAPSNACMEETRTKGSPGMDPCPLLKKHAGIWRYKADKLGQTHDPDNRFAGGLRNVVGMSWNDQTDHLYAMMHGRDQLHQFFPDIYTQKESAQLPAGQFHLLKEGDNVGWPYCYYNQMQEKKLLNPEYGGNNKKVGRCDQYKDPLIGFPGHWAPNSLTFYHGNTFPEKFQGGAFIAFHGSWNRAPYPQQGYKVAFVPFNGEKPEKDDQWSAFANKFPGKEELKSPNNAEYRPMGLTVGPNGSLFITDSQQGKVWRVRYTADT